MPDPRIRQSIKRLLLSRYLLSRGGNGEVFWQLQSAVNQCQDGGKEEEESHPPELKAGAGIYVPLGIFASSARETGPRVLLFCMIPQRNRL